MVNLGDHNLQNAVMFIDKYQQVPRILNPVVLVVDALPGLCRDPKLAAYVNSVWGGVEECRCVDAGPLPQANLVGDHLQHYGTATLVLHLAPLAVQ